MKFKILIILFIILTAFIAIDVAPNPISANGIYTKESCKIKWNQKL